MREYWPRSPVQTERSEVCTSDRGQDSPIQTDLARLIRCLLYDQTWKQRNKNINFDLLPRQDSNLPTFTRFHYLLPREGPLILPFSIINRNRPIFSYSLFVTFWGQLLQQDRSRCRSRWENLDRGQDFFVSSPLRHGHIQCTLYSLSVFSLA